MYHYKSLNPIPNPVSPEPYISQMNFKNQKTFILGELNKIQTIDVNPTPGAQPFAPFPKTNF